MVSLLAIVTFGAWANDDAAKKDFVELCAGCHGIDGKGKQGLGKKGWEYPKPPPDLTHLSQYNGGHFPYIKIRKIIDGRPDKGNIRGHGSSDMPVWGRAFVNEKPGRGLHAEAASKMRILNIVDYLASIQEIDLIKIKAIK